MIRICIFLYSIFFTFSAYTNYSANEKRFYTAQVKFIKSNWGKLIKNESHELIDISNLTKFRGSLKLVIEEISNCRENRDCLKNLKIASSKLSEIENYTFLALSNMGALNISVIEKNPNKYPLFIKKLTDINHSLSENKIYLNEVLQKYLISSQKLMTQQDLKDLILLLNKLLFQISSLPQTLLNEDAKSLLTLGESEFINQLKPSILNISMGKFHELDKVFNLMNRDLQKNQDLISSNSRSLLMQIHRRWNAILKIVKRK